MAWEVGSCTLVECGIGSALRRPGQELCRGHVLMVQGDENKKFEQIEGRTEVVELEVELREFCSLSQKNLGAFVFTHGPNSSARHLENWTGFMRKRKISVTLFNSA
ncbi:hypothetical protein SRHO_G00217090 [Serrasalmus rhombeus]